MQNHTDFEADTANALSNVPWPVFTSGMDKPNRTEPASRIDAHAETLNRINALSASRHGIVSRSQLLQAGITRSACDHLVSSKRYETLGEGVLRASGAPESPHTRAMAAVTAAGPTAMLSHTSAAALWGLPGFDLEPFHVTVVRSHNPIPSRIATVHRQRSVARIPPSTLEGLPVVRPEVLIIQLCALVHPERAARLLDRAWSERLLSGSSLARVLSRIDTQGLRGVRVVRELLEERGKDYVPPASGLEARVVSLVRDAGLPELDRQVDLGDDDHWCGRVDFVDRARTFVLEVDSEKFHSALTDRDHDLVRTQRLESAGFTVAAVTDTQVWHRPWEVINIVRRLQNAAQNRNLRAPGIRAC